jgi:hypothetical protein
LLKICISSAFVRHLLISASRASRIAAAANFGGTYITLASAPVASLA